MPLSKELAAQASFHQTQAESLRSVTRRLTLTGGSLVFRVPKPMARQLGIEAGDAITVRMVDDCIVISKGEE